MKKLTAAVRLMWLMAAGCEEPAIESGRQPILGGERTAPGELPTVALISEIFGFVCSGALITPRVVLTATTRCASTATAS
jgi:hypothetical protein